MVEGGEDEGEASSNLKRPPNYWTEANTAIPKQMDIRDEG